MIMRHKDQDSLLQLSACGMPGYIPSRTAVLEEEELEAQASASNNSDAYTVQVLFELF